jgi:uncharacterized protein YyaL (SSP411 family)
VWTKNELKNILGDKAELLIDYYNVTETGNWESGNNILYKTTTNKVIANKNEITESQLAKLVLEAKQLLLEERNKRTRPALDDKILTSWNALMLKAYIDAYRVFDNEKYLDIALKNAEFIITKIKSIDNRLIRNYKNSSNSINAFLDDYAFTIDAFISLYQATFDEKWLIVAEQLNVYSIAHFYDNNSGMFYYTSDIDQGLIARKMEVTDNVNPSSNSQMAINLFVLGQYLYNDEYIKMSKKMLNNVKENALKGAAYYANWDILMTWFVNEPYEVAIVGDDFDTKRKEFDKYYLPNVFLSGGKNEGTLSLHENKFIEGQTTIYVCQNKVYKLPVTEFNEAIKQILNIK